MTDDRDPHTLDPAAVSLLRSSFATAAADAAAFARDFYARLFELAPTLRGLFPADLSGQQEKMAQTLGTVVAFIDDPAALRAELARLGARHRSYGAAPVHYAIVGEALLHTLQARTPDGLSAAACSAWKRLYGWLASAMLTG